MSASRLIMAFFFLQPLAFGAWLPRIPDVQARLGLEPGALGLALVGLPLGLLLAMPFVGTIVTRLGGRRALILSTPLFLVAISLPAMSVHIAMLFAALLLTGVTMSTVELAMNIVADEVEKRDRVAIMSRCHGFWSLGMMLGSLAGATSAHWGIAPQIAIPAVAIVSLLAVAVAIRLPADPAGVGEAEATAGLFIPGWLLAGICIVALASNILEGAAADWSAVYLRDVVGAEAGAEGLGYTAYALLMALGRFAGDRVRTLWGPVVVARVCYGIALAGLLLVIAAPSYPVVLAGFALAGFGGSVGVPLAISAAASLGGRPPAANVAMVSLVSLIGFLCSPVIIGSVAQFAGLRLAFGLFVLPVFVLAIVVAAALRSRPVQAGGSILGSPGPAL